MADEAASPAVQVVRDGAIAEIVLNRPDKRNAVDWEMWRALRDAVAGLGAAAEIRAVVVRGADATAFAAGADLEELARVFSDETSAKAYTRDLQDAQEGLARLALPTIALIRGPCIGAGCGIALACDIRWADRSARFAFPPAKLGLVYGLAETKRLVNIVGPSRAKHMLFSAATLDAEEALSIGLVDRVVEAGDIGAETRAYAQAIASLSGASVRVAKRFVHMILDGAGEESDATRQVFIDAFKGADAREGLAAFREKRKPRFS